MSTVAALSSRFVSIFPDAARRENIAASDYDPEVELERRNLAALVGLFARENAVENESARTAISFLRLLPPDRAFPNLSADGEGALIMIWEVASESLMITVEGSHLLPVSAPATPASQHLPAESLKGDDISSGLLRMIPPR